MPPPRRLADLLENYGFAREAELRVVVTGEKVIRSPSEEIVHASTFLNWFRLGHMVQCQGHGHLNHDEKNAYRILQEYVNAVYFSSSSLDHLFKNTWFEFPHMAQDDLLPTMFNSFFTEIARKQREARKNGLPLMPRHTNRQDDLKLYNFLMYEMCDFPAHHHHINLVTKGRLAAANIAFCQRIAAHCAWSIVRSTLGITVPQVFPDRGPLIRPCPWLDFEADRSDSLQGWPEYLWHIDTAQLVYLGTDPVRRQRFRLTDTGDIGRPDYVAVSHTWGRWIDNELPGFILPGGFQYPIPRNKTFDVAELPQSLQTFTRLNNISAAYVWLDLVCIPQGEDDALTPDDRDTRLREIARQGSIFHHADRAIAWLHDVQHLSCLASMFELSCLLEINVPGSCLTCEKLSLGLRRRKRQLAQRIRGKRTGLMSPPKAAGVHRHYNLLKHCSETKFWLTSSWTFDRIDGSTGRIAETVEDGCFRRPASPWFTSLWTLQEICLRPDMWLATCDWRIMALEDGSRIPFIGLLAFLNIPPTSEGFARFIHESTARQFQELNDCVAYTHLDWLPGLDQIDILALGDRRQCTGRRAEAIMSALGATQWFDQVRAGTYTPETDLVMNKYPEKFIDEVKRLRPGSLMTTYTKIPASEENDAFHVQNADPFKLEDGEMIVMLHQVKPFPGRDGNGPSRLASGSLLPFNEQGSWYYFFQPAVPERLSNGQVQACLTTWRIQHSGTTLIQRACIFSSNRLSTLPTDKSEPLRVTFYGFTPSAMDDTSGQSRIVHNTSTKSFLHKMRNGVEVDDVHSWVASRPFEIHLLVTQDFFGTWATGLDSVLDPASTDTQMHLIWGLVLRGVEKEASRAEVRRYVKIGFFCIDHVTSSPLTLAEETTDLNWAVL
ncbi:hypothetical protein XA68_11678 [Ophiocordyceps unilateralis]|uniref:Heterokaryon incompatibility domain-containing protein n=1 Tax=Ophiocordyceps unilateralis TaxID=268505 RepID=A0A2A9PEW7_OPHUN|nr:hypothetical protein XA68_11678 [Ophiocordyceps unilateralis]